MAAPPSVPMPHEEERLAHTVFHKIGGYTALQAAVKLFYDKLLADPLLSPYFEGIPMEKLRKKQMSFMAFAFGGTSHYFGRQVAWAHRDMILNRGLNLTHFDAVAGHFVATLQEMGLAPDIINEAATIVLTTRPMFDPEALQREEDNSDAAQNVRLQERLLLLQQARSTAGCCAQGGREHRASSSSGYPPATTTAPGSFTCQSHCSGADAIKVSTLAEVFAPAVQGVDAERFQQLRHQLGQVKLSSLTGSSVDPPSKAARSSCGGSQAAAREDGAPREVAADSNSPQGEALDARRQRRNMMKDILMEIGILQTRTTPTHAPPRPQASRLVLQSSSSSEDAYEEGPDTGTHAQVLHSPSFDKSSNNSSIYSTVGAVQEWVQRGQPPRALSRDVSLERGSPGSTAQLNAAAAGVPPHVAQDGAGKLGIQAQGQARAGGKAVLGRQDSSSSGMTLPGSEDDSPLAGRTNQQFQPSTQGSRTASSPASMAACQPGSSGPASISTLPMCLAAQMALANLSTLTEVTEASDNADVHSERSSVQASTPTPFSVANA